MDIVEIIIKFTKLSLLARDATGSTPVHLAVSRAFPKITQMLVEAAPPEALYLENGVGSTPLEIAYLGDLVECTQNVNPPYAQTPPVLIGDKVGLSPARWNLEHLEVEVPKLAATIEELSQNGKLRKRTKVTTELGKFAKLMETHLETARSRKEEVPEGVKKAVVEEQDHAKTIEYLRKCLVSYTGERQLVHLIDVQKSVHSDLPERQNDKKVKDNARDEGLWDQGSDAKEGERGMVCKYLELEL